MGFFLHASGDASLLMKVEEHFRYRLPEGAIISTETVEDTVNEVKNRSEEISFALFYSHLHIFNSCRISPSYILPALRKHGLRCPAAYYGTDPTPDRLDNADFRYRIMPGYNDMWLRQLQDIVESHFRSLR